MFPLQSFAKPRGCSVKNFDWPNGSIVEAEAQMRRIGRLVTTKRRVAAVPEDPDDDRILECAIEAKSDYIGSGDKDLLRVGQFEGIQITTVSGFLSSLE